MRSRASIKSHPLHPMLIPFPIGFLFGAFIFDAGSLLPDKQSWWTTGYYLHIAGAGGSPAGLCCYRAPNRKAVAWPAEP